MSKLRQVMRSLVSNLEMYPAIWDSNDQDYMNRDEKRSQIAELAKCCGTDVGDIEKKYATLRTRFRKEWNEVKKSEKSGSGTSDIYVPTWEYYNELSFLIPTLVVREGTDTLSPQSSTDEKQSGDDTERKDKKTRRKRLIKDEEDNHIEVVKYMKSATQHLESMKEDKKPSLPLDIQGFLMTLGSDLNSITDSKTRRMLMLDIQNMVFRKIFPEEQVCARPSSAPQMAWHGYDSYSNYQNL